MYNICTKFYYCLRKDIRLPGFSHKFIDSEECMISVLEDLIDKPMSRIITPVKQITCSATSTTCRVTFCALRNKSQYVSFATDDAGML